MTSRASYSNAGVLMHNVEPDSLDSKRAATELTRLAHLGPALEGQIEEAGERARENAKRIYPDELLDSRRLLTGALAHLLSYRAGVPGKTTENVSKRLILVVAFTQGMNWVERLISEGQYIKASAALKQDFEILARLSALAMDRDKEGRTPNAMHAPESIRRLYGELNDIAHIAQSPLLVNLLQVIERGDARALSPNPSFNSQFAHDLYRAHVHLLFYVAREAVLLKFEMYGAEGLDPALIGITTCVSMLNKESEAHPPPEAGH